MSINNYEKIVNHSGSPMLVLAGPGFGKTYLLADRIKRLLKNGISKENITVITFGKDASQSMKNELIDPKGDFKLKFNELPRISTMHSLGNEIVKEMPRAIGLLKTNLKVQEDESIKKLLYRDAAFILGFDENYAKESRECKQHGDCAKDLDKKKCRVCRKYREIMSKCNHIDFDDQILFACDILENNDEILKKYQNQTQHLLVDEYQDINAAQFRLIKLLSHKSRSGLFVVGDDAQSIYGFRGCGPEFILRFKKDYPEAEISTLSVSRRCHEKIMEDAFKILDSYYKDWAGKPDLEYEPEIDEEPKIINASSETAEAVIVRKITVEALQNNQSVLILVPRKEFFPLITKELNEKGIPYSCPIDFLPNKIEIIKKFLDWIKNYNDNFKTRLIIEDLINFGIAKVPGTTKNIKVCKDETIKNRISEEKKIAELWEKVNKKNNLFILIQKYKNKNFTLRTISDALVRLLDLYNTGRKNKGEFLKHLSCVLNIWHEPEKFVEDISKTTKLLKPNEPKLYRLAKITTMRKAKGLTFDVVIVIGLENDIIPNPRGDIREEARLFYVSMTRASKKLFLIHSHKRHRNISWGNELINKPRSRFLDIIGRDSEWRRF